MVVGLDLYIEETTNRVVAAQVVVTILACWLASGIVFGFAALKSVLLSEGVYEWLCSGDEGPADVCFKQELQ